MTSFEDLAQLLIKNVPPSITPDYVRPVCIVKGDFYTMGRQYGRELKQIIYANLLHNLARLNAIWPDKSRLFEELKRYEAAVLAVSPDSISMWQGIADGAGLPYEAAAIYCCYIALAKGPSEGCSTISAYGSACKEGGLIAAANADSFSFTPTSYSPTLVMYPERGNAVIANGGICSNLCLNEKGMIVMASAGGYNGRKEDTGIGIPGVLSTLMLSWKYDLAPQAAGEAARVFTADAENLHCADPDNGSYVIERTACCIHTRRPGDHGERNFLVATNHFISSEMQASRPEDDSRCHNSYSRFATEMKVMQGRYGQLTLKELSKVITMADRYDGENWYRNEWDDEKSYP